MPRHGYDTAKWDALAKCPFFRRSDKVKHRVVCEGISSTTRISLVFLGTEQSRTAHLKRFCASDYENCPVYGACQAKYNEKQGD